MDNAARFCMGWGFFVGLPFVVMVGTVPECVDTWQFATMVATTAVMLILGVAGFLITWKMSGVEVSLHGFIAHCRKFFTHPEKQTQSSPQIDNQEQEVVQ